MYPSVQQRLKNIESQKNSQSFITRSGHKLHYLEFGLGENVVLIFPGMAEPSLKYWELASEIAESGYRVFVLDHLGHGLSQHLLDDVRKVHIDDFQTYYDHAEEWYTHLKTESRWTSVQFVAHSMGGLIATHLAMKVPVARLVLSSPMFAILTKGIPRPIAVTLANVLPSAMSAPFQEEYNQTDLALNQVTQSQERAVFFDELLKANPQFCRTGVTNRWLATSLKATKSFLKETIGWDKVPTLIFQAGQDTFIQANVNRAFASKRKYCDFVFFPDGKHEIFMEKDEIREKVVNKTLNFLKGVDLNES